MLNDEDIYMVPSKDESSLYAQLNEMMALNLTRSSIKYTNA